ncbi:deoxycytidine triphosphate deaminase [Vibrio phage V-YDF132]|nr:deoxycytidine triphosphate deaminase [Vibrio phage V-YDF132]
MMELFDHPHGMIVGQDLHALISKGAVRGHQASQIGSCALDVRLGSWVKTEKALAEGEDLPIVSVTDPDADHLEPLPPINSEHGARVWKLEPQTFCLTVTTEIFMLPPNVSATFTLRSVCARNGLDQVMSVNLWAGFQGSLVLELYNLLKRTPLYLKEFDCIGQVEFRCHREAVPYSGKYQNQ